MSTKLDPFFRDAGLFIFRLVLGFIFVMHGWQNAVTKGWGSTRDSFDAMNIPATDVAATLASWGELVTGVLLILGLLTRLSSFVLLIDMAGAFWFAHKDAGLWSSDGGFEYVLILGACALLLLLAGAGAVSVDKFLFGRKKNSSEAPARTEISQLREGVEPTLT
ncbi:MULTISPECIES: DoxX family protein [Corynebacterium]|uniref:DoxX family protein n=1 Tax=Corynebacterium TaxID=1716 RepID=UPI00195C85ED|nr:MULTISPECIES: DoxX family protein [Corynebacterium]MDN8625316.1 DoxX family protein [Corynebacterium kroppenstedtii]QRQ65064.1 DoxX family protein [Corynebacterium kroppenstedtii]